GEVLHDLRRDIQVHLAASQLVGAEGAADAVREERIDLIRRGRARGQVDIETSRRSQIANIDDLGIRMVADAKADSALEGDGCVASELIFSHVTTERSDMGFLIVSKRDEVLRLEGVPFAPRPAIASVEERHDGLAIVVFD